MTLCSITIELQITLAPAAEASMTPPGDSFQDLSLERSAFPVDHGGLTHTDALFCYFVTAHYVRKEERVQPVNLCHWHTGCGAVLSQMCCQHCRANSHIRVPMPLITSHLWLIQMSPHHWWESPRLHSEQVWMNCLDPSSKSTEMAADAQVPTGCLFGLNQPGSM